MSGTTGDARKAQEERRVRKQRAALAERERIREVVQQAMAEVYSGAGFLETDALLDQLTDRGAGVVLR